MNNLKKNPLDYIQYLNSQAKLKKSKNTSLPSENSIREQNFQLFFNGANDIRPKQKNKENCRSPFIRKVTAPASLNRKRWGTPSTPNLLKENNSSFQTPIRSPRKTASMSDFDEIDAEDVKKRFLALNKQNKIALMEKLRELEDL